MTATLRRPRALAAILALVVLAAACGSSAKPSSSKLSGTLNGSGSTFQKTFDQVVIQAFQNVAPNVTINYAGGGSGKGKTDLQTKTVDWAGTDSLVKAADLPSYQGGAILYFPTVAAPITVSYHLGGVSGLKLRATTLAKIFATKVTTWDDAAIKADNPGVDLPATTITVAHRADASGTTSNFTKFLNAVDPTDWTLGTSDTVNWAANTQAGTGNAGVAQIVQQTNGAIGYVDLADAKAANLQFASVENGSGTFVEPTLAGASAAVAGATVKDDLTYNPINARGADAYPITSPTWIIVYKNQTDRVKGQALKAFLRFVYTDGEGLAEQAQFARLPDRIVQRALAQLDQIQVPAS